MTISSSFRMLNLGCGSTFHADWVNIDVRGRGCSVLSYDLRLGIPFADATFDVVYHSHTLEHFSQQRGRLFMKECLRVLRPGGVVRVAVPDLENITRAYLHELDEARGGNLPAYQRHRWMLIELLDQLTRQYSGGEMLEYWRQSPLPEETFVRGRVGQELDLALANMGNAQSPDLPLLPTTDGVFQQSGEVHRWMYDEQSLQTLLLETGFEAPRRQTHNTSVEARILTYQLDTTSENSPRKPDSLFMEARKPHIPCLPVLKTLSLCSADSGGAGIAALRQHDALNSDKQVCNTHWVARQKGRHKRVYVVPSWEGRVAPMPGAPHEAVQTGYLAYASHLAKQKNRYTPLPGAEYFSVPYYCVDPSSLPFFDDFQVINLHWVAGMFDPARLPSALAGRPVVWTLHDMNPFTGGCHYSDGCMRFTEHCGACPQLQSTDSKDISFQTWRDRMAAYRTLNLHIVTPSQWLADEARKSSLLGRFPVTVIPYCVPVDIFRPLNRDLTRRALGIEPDQTVLLFSAQSLVNRRKGTSYLLEAMRCMAAHEMGKRTLVMLLGNSPPQDFLQCGLRVEVMGHVNNEEHIAVLYNAADAVIVPSLEDNLPNVIIEAAACGTPVVAFASGGIPEMIRHEETGWLAAPRSVEALCTGIEWADAVRGDAHIRRQCRILALEQWNPARLVQSYRTLFEGLCGTG